MTVADINTEEACQISVSQAMKHLRPDNKTEILNAEDTFGGATRSDAPNPVVVAVASNQLEGGIGQVDTEPVEKPRPKTGGLKTTVTNPEAIERDKLNYLSYYQQSGDNHIPGICPCEECVKQQQALMDWAMEAAHQQHAQAIADATAAAEAAQKSGEGPKPMMVTPYKHNWVISGAHPEHETVADERLVDFEGILSDVKMLWEGRKTSGQNCCSISNPLSCLLGI